MSQTIGNLPVGSLIKDYTSTFLGEPIIWRIADKNHEGYPENSVTLITDKIVAFRSFDAMEPNNTDTNRQKYGNNRYSVSNIRQWLNSDAEAGQWYSAQHDADQAPASDYVSGNYNEYDIDAGFLNTFSTEFKNLLLETTLTVALPTVDGTGSETIVDKIFLPSNTEVGFDNEEDIVEGVLLQIFSDDDSRKAISTQSARDDNEYVDSTFTIYEGNYWTLRTPRVSKTYEVRTVNRDGLINYEDAYEGYRYTGIRPLCNISDSTSVSSTKTEEGYYVLFHKATWQNSDGTIIKEQGYASGQTPVYDGENPTRPTDDEYFYTFNSWTPEATAITDDVIYTPVYDTEKSYKYTFCETAGGRILKTEYLHLNDTITKPNTDPFVPGATFTGYNGYTNNMKITEDDLVFNGEYTAAAGFIDSTALGQGLRNVKGQYLTMPEANALNANQIIQYIGKLTPEFKTGLFYKNTIQAPLIYETDLDAVVGGEDLTGTNLFTNWIWSGVNLDLPLFIEKIKKHYAFSIINTTKPLLVQCESSSSGIDIAIMNCDQAWNFIFDQDTIMGTITLESEEELAAYGITPAETDESLSGSDLFIIQLPLVPDKNNVQGYAWEPIQVQNDEFRFSLTILDIVGYSTPDRVKILADMIQTAKTVNRDVIIDFVFPIFLGLPINFIYHLDLSIVQDDTLTAYFSSFGGTVLSALFEMPYIALEINLNDYTLEGTYDIDIPWMPVSDVVTKFWKGTQAEYDDLSSKNSTTLYLIQDEEV